MTRQKLTYLAGGEDGQIKLKTSEREIGAFEVLVKITHTGVCGTDGHDRISGCGLGHEGVGTVEKVGQQVTAVKLGERVGCGWQLACCGHCQQCLSGYRQYCPKGYGQKYGDTEQGCCGDYVVRHQDFVCPLPDALESKDAGPLMCAGITVYEALMAAETKPTDRVGIVGFGGLGHLAVMYARAMGCEVVVLSSNASKKEDAIKLGAEFRVLGGDGKDQNEQPANINVMLFVGGTITDLSMYMPLLAIRARLMMLVIQTEPFIVPYLPFLIHGHRIIASVSPTKERQIDALNFAVRHKIKPWIQEYPMSLDGLNRAFEALDSGKLRYRAVLSTQMAEAGFQ